MRTQVGQWGNSLAFRLPKYVVEELGLKANDAVECRLEKGKLIIEPIRELPELTLEELLEGVVETSAEIDWGKAEGEEVW